MTLLHQISKIARISLPAPGSPLCSNSSARVAPAFPRELLYQKKTKRRTRGQAVLGLAPQIKSRDHFFLCITEYFPNCSDSSEAGIASLPENKHWQSAEQSAEQSAPMV